MSDRFRITVTVLCALMLIGPAAPEGPKGEPAGPAKPAAKVGLARPSEPALSLGIDCLRDAVATAGTPLLLEISLSLNERPAGPSSLTISNPSGGWSDLVRVEVRGSTGAPVTGLRPVAAERTPPSIVLSDSVSGHQWYAMEPVEGKLLPPGDYTVAAILDTRTATGDAWKGSVSSPPCQLTVRPSGAPLTKDESDVAALTAIRLHMLFGRSDSALATVDRLLTRDAKNPLLLEAKGDVLARAARFVEAVAMYDSALNQVEEPPASPLREPPVLLLEKRDEAESRIK